jgi:non-ribosomal peptide synthetase component F
VTASEEATMKQSNEWRAPEVPATVVTAFARQVLRTPERAAVMEGDEALTYAELAVRVHRLATDLDHAGVRRGQAVGVALAPGIDEIVGVLALVTLGAGFLAVDLTAPVEAVRQQLDEADVQVVLARAGAMDFAQHAVVTVDPAGAATVPPFDLPPTRVGGPTRPVDLALVCRTSGRTAPALPVMVEHGQLFAQLHALDAVVTAGAHVVWLAIGSLAHSSSVLERLWPLTRGHQLVFAGGRQGPADIARAIRRHQVTTLQISPSRLSTLLVDVEARPAVASLQQLLVGGEVLPPVLAAEVLSLGVDLWNLYGSAEMGGWATAHRVTTADLSGPIPIGRPLPGVLADVVDQDGRVAGEGVRGELVLGGAAVARGYLGRPRVTGERFRVAVSLTGQVERWFTTGDHVTKTGGTLAYLGRASDAIVVRGRTVTLQAIEAALSSHPGVHRVAVTNRTVGKGAAAVRAIVTVRPGSRVSVDELRLYTTQRLRVQIVLMDIVLLGEGTAPVEPAAPRSALAPAG